MILELPFYLYCERLRPPSFCLCYIPLWYICQSPLDLRTTSGLHSTHTERRMVQPMKIDRNSCKTVREVTEA